MENRRRHADAHLHEQGGQGAHGSGSPRSGGRPCRRVQRRIAGGAPEDLAVQARLHLDLLAEAAEETGDTGLAEDVASATELIARIEKRAQELASEAAKQAGPRLTREELAAKRREETAAAIREEIERQGLTGKATAEIAGVSSSYVSAIVNEKSAGVVATDTLEEMLEALQETAD